MSSDHETVGERTAVVRALGADREDLGPAAHQQHLLVADMADELAAIGKLGERNALGQIGAGLLGMVLSHSTPPRRCKDRVAPCQGPRWTRAIRGRQGPKV